MSFLLLSKSYGFKRIRWLAFTKRTFWRFHRQFVAVDLLNTPFPLPFLPNCAIGVFINAGFVVNASLFKKRFYFYATVNGVIDIDWLDKQTNERLQV